MNNYKRFDPQTLEAIRGSTLIAAEAARQLAAQLDDAGSREAMVRADQLVNRIAAQLSSFNNLRQSLTAEAREHMKVIERDIGAPEQALAVALEQLRDAMDRAERRLLDARPLPPVS